MSVRNCCDLCCGNSELGVACRQFVQQLTAFSDCACVECCALFVITDVQGGSEIRTEGY
jgi:hypothetical protein